jgi:hypothetical protein
MKKLITMAIIASTLAITTMPAQADLKANTLKSTTSTPTLAILDTALDTSIQSISSRVVAEVCILDWPSCPNGKSFMEGPGSTVLPMNILSSNNFNHGTQMASIALANNPNLNIVFVRIFGNTARGDKQTTGINTLVNALNWVKQNSVKYNIVAVSSSSGSTGPVINMNANSNYCAPTALDAVITNLNNVGIPVFFPSGNSGLNVKMKNKIEWPACISQSIAIGGVSVPSEIVMLDEPTVNLQSNYDKKLVDLWGDWHSASIYPGNVIKTSAGTSVATQVIAAKYVALKASKPALSVTQLIELMKLSSSPVLNSVNQDVYLFSLSKAING